MLPAAFVLALFLFAADSVALWFDPSETQVQENAKAPEVVSFSSGALTLHGVVYLPSGPGPFPAVLWNHGSAPGMLSQEAFEALGPMFAAQGWVFFAPWRRGQGLSAAAGPYIGDEIATASKKGGTAAGAATIR
jgi:carboxymethylenebutenolidase